MSEEQQQQETDWQEIAYQLAQRVNFAIMHLKAPSEYLHNADTGAVEHWHDYMRQGMEMLPGFTLDEEIFQALRLPKAIRNKKLKEIGKRREKE